MRTRTTAARHAAVLFAVCGLLGFAAIPAPGADASALALVGSADLLVAALARLLPWDRWPDRATLVLAVPGFAIIAVSEASGLLPARALSCMFVLVFVWVGAHHRRWQSLWVAPLAAAAYIAAVVTNDRGVALDGRAVVLVTLVCVLVAETVARALERLRASEAEMRFLVEHTTDLVTRIGMDGVIRYSSPSVVQVLGWRPDEVIGRSVSFFSHPDDPVPFEVARSHPGETVSVVRRLLRADGTWCWLETVAKTVVGPDGHPEVLTSARDVTRWRESEAQLEHEATHDPLTGLANRALLDARLAQASGTAVTVAFVDLDGFKAVNDVHGHVVGDALLVEAARRLASVTRDKDIVARYGGDEFVLLVEGLLDEPGRQALVRRVEADLGQPYRVGGLSLDVGASVGITVASPGLDAAGVVADADRSMYAVKRTRRPEHLPTQRGVPTAP